MKRGVKESPQANLRAKKSIGGKMTIGA